MPNKGSSLSGKGGWEWGWGGGDMFAFKQGTVKGVRSGLETVDVLNVPGLANEKPIKS